jgi:hypothetical protein
MPESAGVTDNEGFGANVRLTVVRMHYALVSAKVKDLIAEPTEQVSLIPVAKAATETSSIPSQSLSDPRGAPRYRGIAEMKDSARCVKIVELSEEDQCYVGSALCLIYGGRHDDDERQVFDELCQAVEEALELYKKDGKPLPPATAGRDLANKLQTVV